jgi:hypothetical protein
MSAIIASFSSWLDTVSLENDLLIPHAITSLVFVTAVWLLRVALVHLVGIRTSNISVDNRRRWRVNIRSAIIFTMLAGLILIWSSEIKSVAFSLVAIAVALVIATKELILCFSGAVFRAGTDAYGVGDSIELNGLRGDVIDQNLFGTTILELGPTPGSRQYTGRAVILPNSLLLSHPVASETFMGSYVVHFITISLSTHDDWQKAEEILLRVAEAECAPFIQLARKHMVSLEKKHWIDTPSVDPRVTFYLSDPGVIKVLLRVPAPTRKKGRIEQAILREFLKEFRFAFAPELKTGTEPPERGSTTPS